MNGEIPDQQGNNHPTQAAMGAFRSKDGLANIAASSPRLWERFCRALDANALSDNPDYSSPRKRRERKVQLNVDINAITEAYTTAELVETLNNAGVPCGPINNIGEGFEDPQVKHLEMVKPAPHPELDDLGLVRSPINLSLFPEDPSFRNAAPDPGADSDSILEEFGYSTAQISAFHDAGVI